MTQNKSNIALLLGDPAGIGPELISKLLNDDMTKKANIVIIGEKQVFENGNSITNALDKDKVLRNATRFALKLGEHTWGGDKKRNLFDDYSWKNVDFEKARAKGSKNSSQYLNLESTWWEQRQWGVTILMETLLANQHPLAKKLMKGF